MAASPAPATIRGRILRPPQLGGDPRERLARVLEHSPAAVPAFGCIAIFVWFAGDEGGFNGTTFLPATLLVLGLLAVALGALPRPAPSRRVLVAIALLTGYALWSYLSILWAAQQGMAWDGANRTLLYAAVLALFALWPIRGQTAAFLLGTYGVGVAAVGLVELLRADAATRWVQYFHEGRLGEPAGYVNANVALWFAAFLACLVLGSRRGVAPALRGLLMGCATLLAGLALLGQSRGWLFVLPVVLVLALALVPGRGRTIVALLGVAVAIAAAAGPLLDVYDAFRPFRPTGEVMSAATRVLLGASFATGLVAWGAGVFESTVVARPARARRISAAFVAALAALGLCGLVAYAVVKGNPVTAVGDKWDEFKKGGSTPQFKHARFSTSVTTYRYDYWRVAWNEFERQPLHGVGVDNFLRDYLVEGKSDQTPAYPHSTPLRALSETGLVGGMLFFGAVVAGLAAALPGIRRPGLAGAAAGAGTLMFAYWFVHGSIDWLWEFAGLGGPALAGLGLAAALGARTVRPGAAPVLAGRRRPVAAAAVGLLALIALVPAWLSERDLRGARAEAGTNPAGALGRLDRAASLNPLSPLPDSTAGTIRVGAGDLLGARRDYRHALERYPYDPFATVMLAGIASSQGLDAEALRLASRAHELAPKDAVIGSQLRRLRARRQIDPLRIQAAFRKDIQIRIGND